jgi:hypothetical protein
MLILDSTPSPYKEPVPCAGKVGRGRSENLKIILPFKGIPNSLTPNHKFWVRLDECHGGGYYLSSGVIPISIPV